MKRFFTILIMIALLSLSSSSVEQIHDNDSDHHALHRYKAWDNPAPVFKATDYYGTNISLKDYRGSWVLLCFWSSISNWNGKYFSNLKSLEKKFNDKLIIICINCYDSIIDWESYIDNSPFSSWTHIHIKPSSKIYRDYHISVLPTTILINPEGNIIDTKIGSDFLYYIPNLESLIYF